MSATTTIEMYKLPESVTVENAVNTISHTSKMGRNVFNWSLNAGYGVCLGSYNKDGSIDQACKICYAKQGTYHFKNVINVRAQNKLAWQRKTWVIEMVAYIKTNNVKYFRFFDSGDVYSLKLAAKIYTIMRLCPNTFFWLPTRMYKFDKFRKMFEKMNKLSNVVVRYSSSHIFGQQTIGDFTSSIIPNESFHSPNAFLCMSHFQDGACHECKACWSKDYKVIEYFAHGQKAKREYKK